MYCLAFPPVDKSYLLWDPGAATHSNGRDSARGRGPKYQPPWQDHTGGGYFLDIKQHAHISKVDEAKTKENPDANGISSKDDFNNGFSNITKQEMNSSSISYTHMILQFTGIR